MNHTEIVIPRSDLSVIGQVEATRNLRDYYTTNVQFEKRMQRKCFGSLMHFIHPPPQQESRWK